jgi:hypothetical protein
VSTGDVIALVIILVVIAVVAALTSKIIRRQAARRRETGAEFERLARETGPWRARAEFAARRRRVDAMGIKPLSDEERSGYERRWTAAQEQFVDSPSAAVTTAAGLVTAVAAARGYDVSDTGQLLTDLSVHHGQYLDGHRKAAETTGRASAAATEELRLAILGHRALFLDLLAPGEDGRSGAAVDRLRDALRQVRPLPLPLARRRDSDGSDSGSGSSGGRPSDGRPSDAGAGGDLQGDDNVPAGRA